MNSVEDRLHAAADDVRNKATHLPPRMPGEVARRGRAVRVGQLVAAGFAVLALVVAASLALRGGDEPVASSADRFPSLVVDVDRLGMDLALTHVDDAVVAPSPVDPPLLRSYGLPEAGLGDPRLWLVTYPGGSDFFRGEGFRDPGWEQVTVPSGQAYQITDGWSTTVMWEISEQGGAVLRVQGFGVEPATVRAAAVSVADTESGWVPQTLPYGFVELYAGPDQLAPGERTVTLIWTSKPPGAMAADSEVLGAEVTLWLYEGQDASISERNLFGFMPYGPGSDATVSDLDIRGHNGVRFVIPDGVVYHWMETPTVFARLLVQGSVDPQQTLDALVEMDPDTWNEMIESWSPGSTSFDTTATTVAPTTTSAG